MKNFTLSNSAIFCLHQLSRQVYLSTGFRCRLASKINILRLLKFASISGNRMILHSYGQFLKQLSMQQLKLLMSYGIALPARLAARANSQLRYWLDLGASKLSGSWRKLVTGSLGLAG